MHRRKPTSTRKKKEEQKLRKAIKRGDVEPLPKPTRTQKKSKGYASRSQPTAAVDASKKLQSAFVKLSPSFLQKALFLASSLVLHRPIQKDALILRDEDAEPSLGVLTCPKRPPWTFNMTKKEVEKGEEGVFRKWLSQTDEMVQQWQDAATVVDPTPNAPDDSNPSPAPEQSEVEHLGMPRSTTYFERNIEVWRQLWRVTEISQIILILLDSRCPTLHYPPSLSTYLTSTKARHILVLTKVDIAGPERVEAWSNYLHAKYPKLRIMQVEAYAERDASAVHQGRKRYDPHMPDSFRRRFVETLREVHAEMLEPPEEVKSNPKRLMHWKPPVKTDIDWDAVHSAHGGKVGTALGGPLAPIEGEEDGEPQMLTVGLVGQPNVGKSSLLNAIFGTQKVQASKTPGKTKHFQTLFWTSQVRLVDCPGLVMPNYVPMEMQVLSGILPISRISSIPSCIHFAGERLPLEEIFKLKHPDPPPPPVEDKRTWRDPQKRPEAKPLEWTAMDILSAYADAKGWVTAQAGRLDVNRAGNAILRALAESRISWAYWPPGTEDAFLSESLGLWLPKTQGEEAEDNEDEQEEGEGEEDSDDVAHTGEQETSSSDDDDDTEDRGSRVSGGIPASRFALLSVTSDGAEGDSQEDELEDEAAEEASTSSRFAVLADDSS